MNTSDPNTRRDGEEPTLPPTLAAALKELPARRVFVPPTVDEAVLRAARRQLAPRPRAGLGWLRVRFAWAAIAAACLALIGLIYFFGKTSRDAELAREDLNHDGRVDILDAFQLARELRSGEKQAGRDVNGDGVVDERDAALIATHAVKLEKGKRS
jgi:hypothetical protein